MTDKLPPPVLLTEKQARFVEGIGRGMLGKDAYRLAYETEADDKAASAEAAKLKRHPSIAITLQEVLRSRRLQDLDNVGRVISDTLEDQEAARQRGADAAVAAFARMRGNWQGIERQGIVFAAESLLSDEELIHRLAGDDPERIAAAKMLLGAAEGFPEGEPIDTEYDEIATHDATRDGE
jgi:hypothetical protein